MAELSEERKAQITETLRQFPHAVASQGGGLVVWDEEQCAHLFVLPPDWGNYKMWDFMPTEWGTGPVSMTS